jgi:hypothetical protein
MWDPRPLTPLWAFTACYRDSFTFSLLLRAGLGSHEVNVPFLLKKRITACLLKARTVEPGKQSLLGDGCVQRNNGVTVGSGVFYAVRAEAI